MWAAASGCQQGPTAGLAQACVVSSSVLLNNTSHGVSGLSVSVCPRTCVHCRCVVVCVRSVHVHVLTGHLFTQALQAPLLP